jgi:uncharacterized Fe-S center protein
MGMSKPHKHNASCWTCGDDFVFDQIQKTGINKKGIYEEGIKCSKCREAQKASGNQRISKYTWRSLKEIDASWGQVKKGEMWEQALDKFAESLPVSDAQKEALKEALK